MEPFKGKEDSLCLVALCAAEGIGPATVRKLLEGARRRQTSLSALLSLSAEDLVLAAGLSAACARSVKAARASEAAGRDVLERMRRMGAMVWLAGGARYPDRLAVALGEDAPQALFVAGDAGLLDGPCVAIVGSRRPSRRAAAAARWLAGELAGSGFAIVSGGAHGIDMAAHLAAARQGGTVVVLPFGLECFVRRLASLERLGGRWCVVSQFPPGSGWRAAFALMRNRTVVALSEAVVAFEPRDCGGTWHACACALGLRRPLFVVSAEGLSGEGDLSRDVLAARRRGARRLVRLGAVALDPQRLPTAAELRRLIGEYRAPAKWGQAALFASGLRDGMKGRLRPAGGGGPSGSS